MRIHCQVTMMIAIVMHHLHGHVSGRGSKYMTSHRLGCTPPLAWAGGRAGLLGTAPWCVGGLRLPARWCCAVPVRVLRSTAQYALSLGGADRCWRSGALILYRLGEALARAGMGPLPCAGRVVRAHTRKPGLPSPADVTPIISFYSTNEISLMHYFI